MTQTVAISGSRVSLSPALFRQVYCDATNCYGIEEADVMLASLSATITGAPSPQLSQFFSGSIAVPANFFGITGFGSSLPPSSMNFGLVRTHDSGVNWKDIETSQGVYNGAQIAKLDSIVAMARAHKADVIFNFYRTPSWAAVGGDVQREPSSMAYLTSFVNFLYARYGTAIGYYEGWNEPNVSGSFTGTMAQLISHQQALYNAVKACNAALQVISPAFNEVIGLSTATLNLNAYLVAGGGAYSDIIGYHNYKFQNLHPTLAQTVALLPYGRLQFDRTIAALLQTVLSNNGITQDVWCTEVGSSTPTMTTLLEAFCFLAVKNVKRCVIYSWDNAGWPDMRLQTFIADWNSAVAVLSGKTITALNTFNNGDFGGVIDGVGFYGQ